MKPVTYIEEIPAVAEYNVLRTSAGWGLFPDEKAVENGLNNSLYNLCARENGELIGFGRVIGDGAITFYIQDLIVLGKHQRSGIGTEIMRYLMSYISEAASERAIIGLLSAKGKEAFYEKFGFIPRPNETYGKGMFMFWETGI